MYIGSFHFVALNKEYFYLIPSPNLEQTLFTMLVRGQFNCFKRSLKECTHDQVKCLIVTVKIDQAWFSSNYDITWVNQKWIQKHKTIQNKILYKSIKIAGWLTCDHLLAFDGGLGDTWLPDSDSIYELSCNK